MDDIMTLDQALDKVEARFIYNLPESELCHIERLFFQIEQAHWFYEV
jgi:mRNA-decapping enzyme subunit 2